MTNLTALFKCCQEKPQDGKNNIVSHLYVSSVDIEQTNRANKVWYKLKNWITDEHLPQDWSFVVQKHNPITGYVYRVVEYHKKSFQHLTIFLPSHLMRGFLEDMHEIEFP